MSIRLMSAVWQSDLPSDEKFVALAMADWADDSGERIFPSQEYIAWKVGKTSRAVRDTLTKLQDRGVLVSVGRHYSSPGGHGATVEYHLVADALPRRPEWVPRSRAEVSADRLHPEVSDIPPGSLAQSTRKPTSDDPLDDPPVDPPQIDTPRARAKYELPSGVPEHTPEERTRLVAMHRAWYARTGKSQHDTWAGLDLIRRGATESDIDHAITAAFGKGWNYFAACLTSRVEERERGNDPDAGAGGGTGAQGSPGGRGRGSGATRGGGDYRGPSGAGGLRRGAPGSDGRPDANDGWVGFFGGKPPSEAGSAAAGA